MLVPIAIIVVVAMVIIWDFIHQGTRDNETCPMCFHQWDESKCYNCGFSHDKEVEMDIDWNCIKGYKELAEWNEVDPGLWECDACDSGPCYQ